MIKNINKTKLIMATFITIVLIAFLLLTLLATVDYRIESINWGDLGFSIFYWISGRMTYFPIGVEIGEQNSEVQLNERTLAKYRKDIYRAKINKQVAEKFEFRNKIAKTSAYLDLIDFKLNKYGNKQSKKIKKKCDKLLVERERVIEYLDCIENKKEYKGKFNISNVRGVKYDILDFGVCFSYGASARTKGHKYKINVEAEGIKSSIPSFIWSLFMSFMSASVSILTYGFTLTALITFIIKLLLFLMGCYKGITLGRSVIEINKNSVLINITEAVKEVINEIEQETGIVIEDKEQ